MNCYEANMIVHIFTNDGSYNYSFLKFYESNFQIGNELFIFRSRSSGTAAFGSEVLQRTIYIHGTLKIITQLLPRLLRAKKIYFHYLPIGPSLYLFFIFQQLLKKSVWILWGGDVYYHFYRPKNLQSDIYEFIRCRIIKKIPSIACFVKGDYDLVKKIYHSTADYTYAVYPLMIDFDSLDKLPSSSNTETVILAGNSADRSNAHFEIMDILSRFGDESMKILCPLSYGDELSYVASVEKKGKELFGERFVAYKEYIDPNQYGKILNGVDVAIFNHQRQQGLGTLLSLLYRGTKVYVRSDTTSFTTLTGLGLVLFDVQTLYTQNFNEFISMDNTAKRINKEVIRREFSREKFVEIWTNLFAS